MKMLIRRLPLQKCLTVASLPCHELSNGILRSPRMSSLEVLESLRKLSQTASPDVSLLTALAHRINRSSEQYYPPQIIEALGLFADMGFADSVLYEVFAARADDILANPSPKRMVQIASLFARLQLPLFHPSTWPLIRKNIISTLPHMRRGTVSMSHSLAAQACKDETIVTGVFTQLRLVHEKGLLTEDQFLRGAEKIACVKQASIEDELTQLVNKSAFERPLSSMLHCSLVGRFSSADTIELEKSIFEQMNRLNISDLVALSEEAANLGLKVNQLDQRLVESIENINPDDKMFVRCALAAAKLIDTVQEPNKIFNILLSKAIPYMADMSSKRLVALLRVARLTNVDEDICTEITRNIFPNQLSLQERRLFSASCDVNALPPLLPRGSEKSDLIMKQVGHLFLDAKDTIYLPHWKRYCSNRPGTITAETRLLVESYKRRGINLNIKNL